MSEKIKNRGDRYTHIRIYLDRPKPVGCRLDPWRVLWPPPGLGASYLCSLDLSSAEYVYKIPGVIQLLFETPSGFAMFAIAERCLEKDIEHIWTYFLSNYWFHNIIWLHEFQEFEDRPNAINLTTRKINPRLIKMILKYINFEEKLVVGRPEYKEIIEESLELPCLYDDAVKEVMWGIQNLLRTLVPQEQTEITMEDRIPMSKGLDMVLRRHDFVIEPKMINEDIIETANSIHGIDLRERAHSKFLHNLLGEEFMAISGVDIADWPLLKLATAVKKMSYPDEGILVGNPYEMFSRRDFEVIFNDAAEYRDKVDANIILRIYRDVVDLREDKRTAKNKLRRLVKEAKEALKAEEVLEDPATTGVNSKQHACLTVDPPAVPNQSSISEWQHSITDTVGAESLPVSNIADHMENISLHDTLANHSTQEGEEHTSSIFFPQGVPAELTMLRTSEEVDALSTYVQGKVPEKQDENTCVKQKGATLGGADNVGENTVDVEDQAQETGAETQVIAGQEEHEKKTEDSAAASRSSLSSGTKEGKNRWTLFSCFH